MKQTKLVWYGRLFFAISTIAFGIQNFMFDDFVMGRAPAWPSSIPGQVAWAYLSGILLIIAGTIIAAEKRPRIGALTVAVMVLVWALFRHILAGNFQWGTELTWFGKALTLCGGAFAVAGSLPEEKGFVNNKFTLIVNTTNGFLVIGRFTLSIFFIICGIEHFMFVDYVKLLVPEWIPGEVFWTYFGGVALIAGGVGLLLPQTVRLAAFLSGLMVFIWFIILHIPLAIANPQNNGKEWIAVFEALAVSGIAFVLSGAGKTKNHARLS